MADLRIDGGAFIGHDLETGAHFTESDLFNQFEMHGVSAGIVGSYRCIYQDVIEGNREVAALARSFPGRIIPLAIVHPYYYGRSPEQLVQQLNHEMRFKLLGLFSAPAYYTVDWQSPAVKALGEAAAKAGMILQAGIKSEAELVQLSHAWGHLNTTVMVRWMAGHRYLTYSTERLVAAKCPNFVFDLGNVTSESLFERIVDDLGPRRLFIASNSPHLIAACAYSFVNELGRPEFQRALGAGALGEGLLRQLGFIAENGAEKEIPAKAQAGWRELLQRPKVDIHWHPDHWNQGEKIPDMAGQLATMSRYGYENAISFSILGLNYDLSAGNRLNQSLTLLDPKIHALLEVNPKRIQESLEQIETYRHERKFVGLKTIQDAHKASLADPEYDAIFEQAAREDWPVLAHLGGVAQAAKKHTKVRFVVAHANMGRASHLQPYGNVFFDFSTSHSLRQEHRLREFIGHVGADRVMFGSDSHLMSPQWSLAKLWDAHLDEPDLEKVLRANAYRIFPRLTKRR